MSWALAGPRAAGRSRGQDMSGFAGQRSVVFIGSVGTSAWVSRDGGEHTAAAVHIGAWNYGGGGNTAIPRGDAVSGTARCPLPAAKTIPFSPGGPGPERGDHAGTAGHPTGSLAHRAPTFLSAHRGGEARPTGIPPLHRRARRAPSTLWTQARRRNQSLEPGDSKPVPAATSLNDTTERQQVV